MRALLDVNVILALLDFDHIHHRDAHLWWNNAQGSGWASCPLTENGVVRIMSRHRYSEPAEYSPKAVLEWLTEFTRATDHEFWADDLSLTNAEIFDHDRIFGPRQITDIYLLALAAKMNAVFVTFDKSVSTKAVLNALPGHLLTI